ncbi:MAG: hypothetical protein V1729_06200 [Candidatus Woesearchaeota archaeon]
MKRMMIGIMFILLAATVFAAGPKGSDAAMPEPTLYAAEQGQGSGQAMEPTEAAVATATQAERQNQGEESQMMAQERVQTENKLEAGTMMSENGKRVEVQEQAGNRMQLKVGTSSANTGMELMQEQVQEKTMLKAKLSNGKTSEIKIMPDTASEKALERLQLKVCSEENRCTIELKEVGRGDEIKAAYEMNVQKQSKVLGLFKAQMKVQAQIDAENGEVIQSKKPWWAFLATE